MSTQTSTDDGPERAVVSQVWGGAGALRPRLRVFNPPNLVADPSGPVVREMVDPAGRRRVLRFRHDPDAAVDQIVAPAAPRAGRRRRGGRR